MSLYSNLSYPQNKYLAIVFSFIIVIYLFCILIGPRVEVDIPAKKYGINMHLGGPFGVSLDCDTPEFMDAANHPEYLLKDDSVRQSRPGLIFLAYLVSRLLRPIAESLFNLVAPQASDLPSDFNERKATGLKEFPPTYMAYIIINFCLLFLAVFLWKNLLGSSPSHLALPILLLIFFNPIVKIFLFMPHTQIFNVLVPVITYWIVYNSYNGDFILKKNTYWLVAGLGVGLLSYGTFIIPAILYGVTCLLYQLIQHKKLSKEIFVRLTIHGVLFSAPFFTWCTYVTLMKGRVYFHEVEVYDQFVWMKKVLVDQGLLQMLLRYCSNLQGILLSGAEFFPVTICLAIAAYYFSKKTVMLVHFATGTFISLANWLFLAVMGFYPWRLAFMVHLPLWIASSLAINTASISNKGIVWGTRLIIIIYGIYIAWAPAHF